ncbi:nucleoside hydrolase [Moorena sp. SIO4G3]|uniref:nucleoside hydrolase n=1 Tax=Moorena sp. SIO4G3 TaxID=2607821 RepID=UPI0025F5E667|nr:nucleoside hydrolase [Moorena sp. SIO4G3]
MEPSSEDAIDVLLKAAQEYGSDLTIVALGPLTNIATALQRDRHHPARSIDYVWFLATILLATIVTPPEL